jgi:hypothetical protein
MPNYPYSNPWLKNVRSERDRVAVVSMLGKTSGAPAAEYFYGWLTGRGSGGVSGVTGKVLVEG